MDEKKLYRIRHLGISKGDLYLFQTYVEDQKKKACLESIFVPINFEGGEKAQYYCDSLEGKFHDDMASVYLDKEIEYTNMMRKYLNLNSEKPLNITNVSLEFLQKNNPDTVPLITNLDFVNKKTNCKQLKADIQNLLKSPK